MSDKTHRQDVHWGLNLGQQEQVSPAGKTVWLIEDGLGRHLAKKKRKKTKQRKRCGTWVVWRVKQTWRSWMPGKRWFKAKRYGRHSKPPIPTTEKSKTFKGGGLEKELEGRVEHLSRKRESLYASSLQSDQLTQNREPKGTLRVKVRQR